MEPGIEVSTDRAISAALIVNEMITNAAKYAYQGRRGGRIWVSVAPADNNHFTISVRDEGAGLPADFDLRKAKGLGMRIIGAFSKQLNGTVTRARIIPAPSSSSRYRGEPPDRPLEAEMLAQRRAFIVGAEQAALLQDRHHRPTKSSNCRERTAASR